ncbi:hypothetical protein NM208_g5954 [Fusarium decemcellulare]|uniref:Uncharacterized protein n=1 Tax=Fusarium decemcellulare TaxID=57161 RepID=A0ACC1SEY7_9HYPO|nr:hypothetical protein NM208_g5954 [Fusarium decemcellulare]
MHSVIVALVAIAGLASAGPTIEKRAECPGTGGYYVCGTNGFRGYCSSDPCAIAWCPDFKLKTCEPVGGKTPGGTDTPAPVPEPQARDQEPRAHSRGRMSHRHWLLPGLRQEWLPRLLQD